MSARQMNCIISCQLQRCQGIQRWPKDPLFDAPSAINKLLCRPFWAGMSCEWLASEQWRRLWIRTNSFHGRAAFVSTGLLCMFALLSAISFSPFAQQLSFEGQCTHCVTARDTPIVRAETMPSRAKPNSKPALLSLLLGLGFSHSFNLTNGWQDFKSMATQNRTCCSCHKGPLLYTTIQFRPLSRKEYTFHAQCEIHSSRWQGLCFQKLSRP